MKLEQCSLLSVGTCKRHKDIFIKQPNNLDEQTP